jgi:RIO-like serine/threonine protein kinase
MKILASIAHADEESRIEQSEQREQLRRDALHMLKQFQQQMKLEKEKEQELDAMFQYVFLFSKGNHFIYGF